LQISYWAVSNAVAVVEALTSSTILLENNPMCIFVVPISIVGRVRDISFPVLFTIFSQSWPLSFEAMRFNDNSSRKIRLEHLISFSDAIFAFSIIFMAILIQIPNVPIDHMTEQQFILKLLQLRPQFDIYAVSFMIVGVYWISFLSHSYYKILLGLKELLDKAGFQLCNGSASVHNNKQFYSYDHYIISTKKKSKWKQYQPINVLFVGLIR
jgi:hypothetical protein